jgi:predicted small secreted protein
MRKALFLAALLTALTACNTIEGMGRDIGAAGDAITGTASNTKEKMNR